MTTLILFAGKGTREFTLLNPKLEANAIQVLFQQLSQVLSAREEFQAISFLQEMEFGLFEGTNPFKDEFLVLHAGVSLPQFEHFRKNVEDADYEHEKVFTQPFHGIARALTDLGYPIRIISCFLDVSKLGKHSISTANSGHTQVSNQAIFEFKDHAKLLHEGLNFRSKVEIKIHDALLKRGLLIMPLPVAVLGEPKRYREPDFVVVHKGKVGILEIHGDKWHPPETAAAEHERRRTFTRLGVSVYEIFGADRCWKDPASVVQDFLLAFER